MVSSLFWRYKMKKIRELRADEIEVRVGVVRKNGISLLLYKDARCDMNILDETFGITGWKRHHELINGSLFCTVSIKGENGEWISKQDVGVESYTEAVKGAASDSFKRACFNIGIGRELYTAPFIWISSDKISLAEDNSWMASVYSSSVVKRPNASPLCNNLYGVTIISTSVVTFSNRLRCFSKSLITSRTPLSENSLIRKTFFSVIFF